MKDFILTSNRSVYNPLSRVNNKSLQMSSLEIKIVLLLHESSRACLFLCFCSFSWIVCIFLMFLYSYYFFLRLRLRLSHFLFNIGHKLSAIQNPFFSSPDKDSFLHIKLNWQGWRQPQSYTVLVPRAQAVHIILESAML